MASKKRNLSPVMESRIKVNSSLKGLKTKKGGVNWIVEANKFYKTLKPADIKKPKAQIRKMALNSRYFRMPTMEERRKYETAARTKKTATKPKRRGYAKRTLPELRALAKERGLRGYSTMRKAELVEMMKK